MKTSSILTGMGIGLAVGGTAALMGTGMMSNSTKRMAKKKAARAYKSMQHLMGDMSYMFK